MTKTVILQSYAAREPNPWLKTCMDSVQSWADLRSYDYQFVDDMLFTKIPAPLFEKTRAQRVVATDIARLYWLRWALDRYETVVWLDADTYIRQPKALLLPTSNYAIGREVWTQPDEKRLSGWRSYVKVHNAFLMFRRGNPFLEFYIHACENIIKAYDHEHWVPQIIGPKLLTSLHNMMQCTLLETAGALSPHVINAILHDRDSMALNRFIRDSEVPPNALNLCASSVRNGELTGDNMLQLITILDNEPDLFT